ncbi:hypothetical protein CTI12_AA159860 [Artemisia annua]|uniref:DCD domain-containing protein n=1 Tax=Artemisia annua TaxID=35608 RepID=A0A2U1PF06_ARTAN|nr:hypothetical protein CTI12_AA159860 [Artemisia annua]
MGSRKQKNKFSLDWASKEAPSNFSIPARNLRKSDLGGVIFGCTHNTINECLTKHLFGLPGPHFPYIKNISEGLVLFLFNYHDRKLYGIFEAAGPGQMNIDRYAWVPEGDNTGYTSFPAQVRVRVRMECLALTENQFKPIIANNYYESKHFHFELDKGQTSQLISLFERFPVISNSSRVSHIPPVSTTNPVISNSPRVTHIPPVTTTNMSFASVVGKSSADIITTASSSNPTWSSLFKTQPASEGTSNKDKDKSVQVNDWVESELIAANTWEDDSSPKGYEDKGAEEKNWDGKWDQPWESDEDPQVNTTTHNFQLNQDYKANGGMEENKWGGEWEQPWESDVNAQVNTTTDQPDFLQENTWEESQPVPATTDKVELMETQESESSDQSSDNNPDCNKSSSDEASESDEEENHVKEDSSVSNTVAEPQISTDVPSWVLNLIDEVKSLKGSQLKQIVKISMLEKRLVESKQEVQQLKNRIHTLEHGSQPVVDPVEVDDNLSSKSQSNLDKSVYIVGGFDGSSWSSSLESYSPFKDTRSSLNSMQFVKKYASAAILNGELYHFGGEGFHTVKDRLFVVGGANGRQCSSEVEYLDLDIGKWIPTCPMLSKRLAPAMAELNNALYVTGGYDGASYISSFERHDPREEAWETLPSMKTKKGCHSMVILNEKLYTLGGFDGEKYVPTVECFDTRMGSWVEAEPMNISKGNFGSFVLEEKLYTIGGVKEHEEVMDIVECYKEGSGWEIIDLKAIGKRSHFSAIVA